jgi:hypothetical protein
VLRGVECYRAGFFAIESISRRDIRQDIGVRDVPGFQEIGTGDCDREPMLRRPT